MTFNLSIIWLLYNLIYFSFDIYLTQRHRFSIDGGRRHTTSGRKIRLKHEKIICRRKIWGKREVEWKRWMRRIIVEDIGKKVVGWKKHQRHWIYAKIVHQTLVNIKFSKKQCSKAKTTIDLKSIAIAHAQQLKVHNLDHSISIMHRFINTVINLIISLVSKE